MAILQTEQYTIKLSRLLKDKATQTPLTGNEFEATLEAIIQELLGDPNIVIELAVAEDDQ